MKFNLMANIMTTTDSRVHRVLVRLQDAGLSLKKTLPELGRDDQSSQSATIDLFSITTAEQLGTLIQRHRQEKDITQADLADLASISLGTVKNAEQGRNIGVVQMFAILRALGVNIYA